MQLCKHIDIDRNECIDICKYQSKRTSKYKYIIYMYAPKFNIAHWKIERHLFFFGNLFGDYAKLEVITYIYIYIYIFIYIYIYIYIFAYIHTSNLHVLRMHMYSMYDTVQYCLRFRHP